MAEEWFNLCRGGSVDAVLEYIKTTQIPRWLTRINMHRERVRAKRRKREDEEDTFDLVEAPWLKKSRVEGPKTAPEPEAMGPEIPSEILARKRELNKASLGPLLRLCAVDDKDIEALLRKRLKTLLNSPDSFQRTPLHLAAFGGNVPVMKLFLSEQVDGEPLVDVKATAKDNMQPIHFAASAGETAAVKLCIKHGAKVNVRSGKGSKTPLELAEHKGHTDTIEYLKSRGGIVIDEMARDLEFQQFLAAANTEEVADTQKSES